MAKPISNLRKMRQRYVEFTYRMPGIEEEQWRAAVIYERSPEQAIRQAEVDVKNDHPGAYDVQEFVQRVLTEDQAATITAQMRDGTWEGWKFSGDTP